MLGTGVATFGTSPLPVNFGSLLIFWATRSASEPSWPRSTGWCRGCDYSNPAVIDLLGACPIGEVLGGGLPTGGLPVGSLPLDNLFGGLPLGSLPLMF